MEPSCSECPLSGSVKVPGEGTRGKETVHPDIPVSDSNTGKITEVMSSDSYDLVFVGIAPAKTEVQTGRPLVGWSGTLLRLTLAKMQIEDFYLTNTLLCQLPEGIKDSERNLAVECCKERLFEEVRSKKPKLVVAMGNVPLEALTGVDYKIRSVQGRIVPGLVCPILPVIHPASLAHRSDEFYDYVDSLRSATRYLKGTYQKAGVPSRTIINEDNLDEVLRELNKYELLAVDLETTKGGFFPYGRDPDKIRCVCIAPNEREAYIFPGESSPHFEPHPDFTQDKRLKDLLHRKKCLFHNGPFDIGFLKQAGYDVEVFFDTFLGHYLMDERQYSHGLKALARKYLGAPDWEEDIKKYLPHKASSYDLIPDDALYEYAAYDVAYTYQLSEGMGFRKRVAETFPYKNILGPCISMFAEIRHRGFPIDVGLLMDLDSILEKEMEEQLAELYKLADISYINPFSPTEVAELLFDILGYQPVPGYGRSTAAKHLKILGGPICEKIMEIREFGKQKSTYVMGLTNFIDYKFRIHPFTKLHAAVTGRISEVDPSMLNVHKKGGIRRLYVPEEGHLILEADQKQMELRCLALASQDEHLLEIIRKFDKGEGPDPHQLVNDELDSKTGKSWERDKAKAGVFGRAYGRGKKDFMESYRMSSEDTDALLSIIDGFLPGLKAYNSRVKDEVHGKGILTSYFGRKRRFGLILDENKHDCYRQGANFYPQSMGSDLNLLCMLHLWSMKDKWGIYPLFPVHDSIVMDIPSVEVVPDVKREMEEYSSKLVNGELSFKVDCSVGKSWGDAEKLKL